MLKTDATKVRVEVDKDNRNLIWVRNVKVNPDQLAVEAMQGLPCSSSYVADLTQEMWGGDKDEREKLVKLGITKETRVDIPIYSPRRVFTTREGRKALLDNKLGYGLPFCLTPLKDAEIRKALRAEGIWWIIALGQSNAKFLLFEGGYSHPVVLGLHSGYLGCGLGYVDNDWFDSRAVVGSPQVSKK